MPTLPFQDRIGELGHASTAELLEMIEQALSSPATAFESRASAKHFKLLLDALHAKLRRHHAVGMLSAEPGAGAQASLTDADPRAGRLNEEHTTLLGMLGRLCEQCYAVSGLSPDEQELFVLRCRELLAVFRRHKCEEDLLYYQNIWREVGGEGG